MDKKLLKYFSNIQPLSDEEIKAIDETMSIQHFKKDTILLEEGQTSTDVYFFLEGIIRQYYLIDGEEKTTNFYADEQWVVSLNRINLNNPSTHYLECCTDCSVLTGNSKKGEDLYKKFPDLGIVSRKLMENVFADQQTKMEAFTINPPIIRYQNLLKSNPDLFQRIPQYQIASYIGVTPESLSRIRKRLLSKTKK
ncbi:Crp/Fnr family transcriptional regulator [Flavobacterium sp.]|uniref:Crp/Fnr family transcriptional regulator n=1 Tax=Flavobacterium sp. TaxID=239 RepID=UPI003BBCDD40